MTKKQDGVEYLHLINLSVLVSLSATADDDYLIWKSLICQVVRKTQMIGWNYSQPAHTRMLFFCH